MRFPSEAVRARLASAGLNSPVFAIQSGGPGYREVAMPRDNHELDFNQLAATGQARRPSAGKAQLCLLLSPQRLSQPIAASDVEGFGAVAMELMAEPDPEQARNVRLSGARLFDLGYVPLLPVGSADGRLLIYAGSARVLDKSAIYPFAQSRISMSTLGTNGRFANQLFQYAFLRLYALRHSADLYLPEWPGRALFDLNDALLPPEPMPELRYFAFDDDDRLLWTLDEPPVQVDFWGYFQELPASWKPHRQLLRTLFSLRPELSRTIAEGARRIRGLLGRPMIAIHVRRGDYLHLGADLPWYRPVPLEWYRDWLRIHLAGLRPPLLYVASDDLNEVLDVFADFKPRSFRDSGLPPDMALIFDFEMLRQAQSVLVANSSFSRMAAILGDDVQKAYLADFDRKGFVDYGAWNEPGFWARFEVPGKADASLGSSPAAIQRRGLHLRRELGRALFELQRGGRSVE